jgi:hypothetical protein
MSDPDMMIMGMMERVFSIQTGPVKKTEEMFTGMV